MKKLFALACVAVVLGSLPAAAYAETAPWSYWEARKAWSAKNGIGEDWNCGFGKLLEAAEKGDTEAQILAGVSLFNSGIAPTTDEATGFKWLEKAAATGSAVAQLKLAEKLLAKADKRLKEGSDRPYSLDEVLQDAKKTCADKDKISPFRLPRKPSPAAVAAAEKDNEQALELLAKAAAQGNAEAQYRIARERGKNGRDLAAKGKDGKSALDWYQSAADSGHAGAQAYLAELYTIDDASVSPLPKDMKKAAELYEKAAEQGHTVAAHVLAHLYLAGQGVEQDHAKALKWFRETNNDLDSVDDEGELHIDAIVDAKINIGLLYQQGLGVAKDEKEAVRWFRRAAHFLSPPAQYLLGQAYETGTGVPQDNFEAYVRYKLSTIDCCTHPLDVMFLSAPANWYSPVKNMDAKKKIEELAKKLTPEELKRADESVEEDGEVLAGQDASANSWYQPK